jgi:uncharacterized membrane protein
MCVKQQAFGTMCRIMDTEYLVKQHNKITQQFRHDIIMQKLKEKENKEYKNMFIKLLLIFVIAVLLITLIAR